MRQLNNARALSSRLNARPGQYLDDAAIRAVAPSVFADQAHGSRSDRFMPIPTAHVLTALRREGFGIVQASQSKPRDATRHDFTKHMLRLRRQAPLTARKVGDVFPEVVLVNANDGSSSYVLNAGLFRLICLNGMVVSEREFASIRVTHTGDVVSRVIEGSFSVLDDSQKALGHAETWSTLTLNPREQRAFGESARVLRFGDAEGNVTTPITADQLLRPRRTADADPTLWNVFNRVQENAMKGGLSATTMPDENGRTRRVITRPVNGIDGDLRLNKALWLLAETLADRKAA